MFKFASLFGLVFLLTSCASAPLNEVQEQEAKRLIKDNNVQAFKALVESSESKEVGQYACLLNDTLQAMAQDKVCRPEIASLLLQKGANYVELSTSTEFHGSTLEQFAASSSSERGVRGCQRMMNFTWLLASECSDMIKDAITRIDPMTTGSVIKSEYRNYSFPIDRKRKDLGYVPEIQKKLETTCLNASASPSCKLAGELKDLVAENSKQIAGEKEAKEGQVLQQQQAEADVAKMDAEAKYRDTPIGRACEAVANIKTADKTIADEKKAASESGFINKVTMAEMGKMKAYAQKELKEMKNKIKIETGKDFKPNDCR